MDRSLDATMGSRTFLEYWIWLTVSFFIFYSQPVRTQNATSDFYCPRPCEDKLYPDENSCELFWNCSSSCESTQQSCPEKQHFAYSIQKCNDAGVAKCQKNVFNCNFEPNAIEAVCTQDTVIAVDSIELLRVNKSGCMSLTSSTQCCGLEQGGCRGTNETFLAWIKASCGGFSNCSVSFEAISDWGTSTCRYDAMYIYYRCIVESQAPETTTEVATTSQFVDTAEMTSAGLLLTLTTQGETADENKARDLFEDKGVIIGVAVGIFVAIILIIVICCLFVRSKRKKKEASKDFPSTVAYNNSTYSIADELDMYEQLDAEPQLIKATNLKPKLAAQKSHDPVQNIVVENDLYGFSNAGSNAPADLDNEISLTDNPIYSGGSDDESTRTQPASDEVIIYEEACDFNK